MKYSVGRGANVPRASAINPAALIQIGTGRRFGENTVLKTGRKSVSALSYELVRQAILEKRAITAIYHGQYREMCPHVLGTKRGKIHALFYQFGGESNSRAIQPDGSPSNWRCIDIDNLSNVAMMGIGEWHTAPDHSRPQTCVDQIDLEVAY